MSNSRKPNTFFGGAAILAAGIMLVKVISAVYKMPLINVLGSGYTDFTSAFNIFNILLMISTAGVPVAVSKMISEAHTQGRENQVNRIFQVSCIFFFSVGLVCSLAMYLGAESFAAMMGNPKAAPSMRVLAPSVALVAGLACFRGYAQGHSHMTPSSVSQIIEALFKLIVGLSLALVLLNMTGDESLAAAGAIAGVTISELMALLYMGWEYRRTKRLEDHHTDDQPLAVGAILKTCLALAVPITLTSSSTSIITAVDNSLVMQQLQRAVGLSLDQARDLFANYSGVQTVYQIPASLMVAITASVIPAVTVCFTQKDHKGAARVVGSALKTAAIIALPSGVGMMVLGKPIVQLLFPALDAEIAGTILSILGLANVFVCLMLVCNSIMQSHSILNLPIFTMLIGGVIMVLFDYFVVAIPEINIYGSPIGTCLCYGITCLLDLLIVSRVVPNCPNFIHVFWKPVLSAALMGGAAWGVYGLIFKLLASNTLAIIASIGVAALVYFALLILLKAIEKDDLALMPKGDKIGRLLGIR